MSKIHEISINAQNSIYNPLKPGFERILNIAYSVPENGTDENTGILLLIPGFGGGNIYSSVFRKIHLLFPDMYNIVVVQCDYFGIAYMGTFLDQYESIKSHMAGESFNESIPTINVNECVDDCCDMGIMQACDNINALLYVISRLTIDKHVLNYNKIICYGSSHGAYLSYYINRICPGLINLIIDNSAYIMPFVNRPRGINMYELYIYVKYFVQQQRALFLPDSYYDLNTLYSDFNNHAAIIAFHGKKDALIPISDKRDFICKINRASLIEIGESDIDNRIFKSSSHGLDADFLKLFDFVWSNTDNLWNYSSELTLPSRTVLTYENQCITISYDNFMADIHWEH